MFDKTKITKKIEPYIAYGHAYILSLRDIRNVGLLIFTVIVLLISWSGVKSIQTNYGLQKQIARMTQENEVRKLQNTNLEFRNGYYKTNQYLELTARQNLGLALPGETLLLVPRAVALDHTVKMDKNAAASTTIPSQPFWQANFESWIDFFLHRNANQ